ncbi:hypothetical protein CGZ91_02135 [Parenemella sanctibonifatiensis]|uniref:Bax inhibitor-1/YccA family protein n=2 Tax=Parenemella sanctibonifatiensis TaxID=2016505 RepID=A0A255EMP9_9ACTN|nr:hypothetical protein CGZ91_02135 [Parenemella sanctibonifatiensis]
MMPSPNPALSRAFDNVTPQHQQQFQGQQYQQQYGGYQQQFTNEQGYGWHAQQPHGAQGGFDPYAHGVGQMQPQRTMTIDDVVTKTAIIFAGLLVTAALTWLFVPVEVVLPFVIGASVITFVMALVLAFRRQMGPVSAIAYGLVEGVVLGGFSKFFEMLWPGIVMQAVLATFAVAAVTLIVYRFFDLGRKVGKKFNTYLTIAIGGFAAAMLLNLGVALFNGGSGLGLREIGPNAGLLSIGITILAVVLATLSLVSDFAFIEQGVKAGVPVETSWRCAFGLTVTLVWLYLEMLRLLSYLRR